MTCCESSSPNFRPLTPPTSPCAGCIITDVLPDSKLGRAVIADESVPIPNSDGSGVGWEFKNPGVRVDGKVSKKINWYYYISPHVGTGAGTIGPVTTFSGITANWVRATIKNCTMPGLPFFNVYSSPTSSGDAAGFYHSRGTYEIPPANVPCGQEAIYYVGANPTTVYPNLPHIQAILTVFVSGTPILSDFSPSDDISLISFGTNSGALVSAVDLVAFSLGTTINGVSGELILITAAVSTPVTLSVSLPATIITNSLTQFDVGVNASSPGGFLFFVFTAPNLCKKKTPTTIVTTVLVNTSGTYRSGIVLTPSAPGIYALTIIFSSNGITAITAPTRPTRVTQFISVVKKSKFCS